MPIRSITPFSLKAHQELLSLASEFAISGKQSPIIKELAKKIIEQNLPDQETEIHFNRGAERIDLRLSKDGEIVKFVRTGGKTTVNYVRGQAQETVPAKQYNWTSLNSSKKREELQASNETANVAAKVLAFAILAPIIAPLVFETAMVATEVVVGAALVATAATVMTATAAPLLIAASILAAPVVVPVVAMGAVAMGMTAMIVSPIALPLLLVSSSLFSQPVNHYHHY